MTRTVRVIAICLFAIAFVVTGASAQSASPETAGTTGGLSLGISGMRSSDGTTVVGDLMWVGAEMTDGPGLRIMRQGLAARTHGYAAVLFIGGPARDSAQWLRLDFGMGYVGQQSGTKNLQFYQRHGVGVLFGSTIAPRRFGIVRPELNGWAVVGTSARFLGASIGARILDPRQR